MGAAIAAAFTSGCRADNPDYQRPKVNGQVDAKPPGPDTLPPGPDSLPPKPDSLPPQQDADPNPPVDVAAPPEPPPVDALAPDTAPDVIADLVATPDLAPTPDVTSPADAGPDSPPACGGFLQPNISKVLNADGLAFGLDGTLYYSTTDTVDGWIGRLLPNGTLDARWAKIEGEPTTWGLAIDNTRHKLYYAGAKSSGTVHVFDLTVPRPTSRLLVKDLGQPNDLAVAGDGTLVYSDIISRHVQQLGQDGIRLGPVSTSPIGNSSSGQAPAGLAFWSRDVLMVGMQKGGPIIRLTLNNNREVDRQDFGSFRGWANGLAFDSAGRLYVGLWSNTAATQVLRLDAMGNNQTMVFNGAGFASLAFGRGMLDCFDIYAAVPDGVMQRQATGIPGLLLLP